MIIRPETTADVSAIRYVTEQAFGNPGEARLIEELRAHHKAILSLVAVHEEQVVGHILFSPVAIEAGKSRFGAVGLGPMAVLPEFQRRGIGSDLVREGLERLRKNNHAAVVVLGHPEFYPRFGFVPASTYGIKSQYSVPDEAFMAVELVPNSLAVKSGIVVYPAEFNAV